MRASSSGRRSAPQIARRTPRRRRECAQLLSAEDEARRLRADAHHGVLDVAERDALRHDGADAVPASTPVSLASERWAKDYNEIKSLGGRTSTARSARQTEDARFWLVTGAQSYHPMLRELVAAKKMTLVDSARFMALASVACADAFIAVFDAKYHYDLLAADHRHPQRRHRRQPGDRARRVVAADRQHPDASGVPVRALHHQRRLGERGRDAVRQRGCRRSP